MGYFQLKDISHFDPGIAAVKDKACTTSNCMQVSQEGTFHGLPFAVLALLALLSLCAW